VFRAKLTLSCSPKFIVGLIKEPSLPPIFAKFRVPLWFNKLDLRDFLFHCYNVRAFNIRSNVVQRPIEQFEDYKGTTRKRWHRRQALKFMIIEMDKPFIWPEVEKDWDEAGYVFKRQLVTTINSLTFCV
jgi:large subunit ribosomal protein L23